MKMSRDEALSLLSSDSAHTRGVAARVLLQIGLSEDLPTIRRRYQLETVYHIKNILRDAIERLTKQGVPDTLEVAESAELVSPEVRQQILGEAVEWVAGILLHEIASPIGLAKDSAKSALGASWENSETERHFARSRRIFDAIEKLKDAAGVPRPEEFDLALLIGELIESELIDRQSISLHGPQPLVVKGDISLIEMAVANGIRNAIESVVSAGTSNLEHSVVVTWGTTDVDNWVAVLDRGLGIVGPVESAFEIGSTNKPNHSGFGLAIARRAMNSLGGTVLLEPTQGMGAKYTARWKK